MERVLFAAALAVSTPSLAFAQDSAAGEKLFAQCRACHQVGETAKNTVGPILNGIIGRQAATLEGYSYSAKMKEAGIAWNENSFSDYIKDPKAKVPGTKMIYPGLKDAAKIADLLAYLRQFDASGKRMP